MTVIVVATNVRSGGPASSNQAERTGTRQGQLTRQVQFTRQGQVRVKDRYAPRKGMQQGQAHGKGRYAAGTWTCHGQVVGCDRYAARIGRWVTKYNDKKY